MLYKKKKKQRKKLRVILTALLLLAVFFVVYFEGYARPYQANLIESRAKVVAEEAIAEGVERVLTNNNYTYESFAKIKYGDGGGVKSVSIDTINVNRFKNEVSREIQSILEETQLLEFKAPLGTYTGLTLLAKMGPQISVYFRLAGSFNSDLNSTFESVGNNQAVHHIELDIVATVVSTAPGHTREFVIKSNFEVAQTVIVGEISNYVWGGAGYTYAPNSQN